MLNHAFRKTVGFLSMVGVVLTVSCADAAKIPAPLKDEAAASGSKTIILAGGCFWGVEAVFRHLKGVTKAVSGYTGGSADTANYKEVSGGRTGHAEAVEVTYDPAQITAGTILQIYFDVAHNPTTLNYQGPDHGSQYRSAIFTTTAEQATIARDYIAQIDSAKVLDAPIVTTIENLEVFYPAEAYHQDYLRRNPYQPYIVMHDKPKIAHLKASFPTLYIEE